MLNQKFVASTGLGDHQGRLSAPTYSLHEQHMRRNRVLITITSIHCASLEVSILVNSILDDCCSARYR